MQDAQLFIGVDVAKAQLAVAGMPGKAALMVANTTVGIRQWLRSVPDGALIAMESSGRYHAELARMCHQRGLTVYVLNAHDVYFYAKGLGMRGKTDPNDAEVIARYVREHHAHLHPWTPPSDVAVQIQQLLRCRGQVARYQGTLRMSLKPLVAMKTEAATLNREIDKFLRAMDEELDRLIARETALLEARRRLMTITGIGPQISALLAVIFQHIGFRNADAVVAYTGLDPRPADSGQKHGRRRITKRGSAFLRRQLWLAGFSASHSTLFKPVYQAIRQRGFSTTEAMLILARKLLRIAWAVWRTGQPFDPNRMRLTA